MVAWLPALILGKRAFCHYLCPFGVLNMVASKLGQWLRLPQLHLRAQPERCVACHRCERACPMSLPVTAMVQRGDLRHRECILCGTCIDTCPKDSLRYGFGRQVKG
jgi:polyferredoxin